MLLLGRGRSIGALLRPDLLDHFIVGQKCGKGHRLGRLALSATCREDDFLCVIFLFGMHVVFQHIVEGDEFILMRRHDHLLVIDRRWLRVGVRLRVGLHVRNIPFVARPLRVKHRR